MNWNPSHVVHRYMVAAKMAAEGYPRKAIAERMGATVWQVNCYINYAKRLGINVLPETDTMLLRGLPPQILVWLKGQVPKGGSVGDVVRAIITDTFYDDMEKQQ